MHKFTYNSWLFVLLKPNMELRLQLCFNIWNVRKLPIKQYMVICLSVFQSIYGIGPALSGRVFKTEDVLKYKNKSEFFLWV